MDTGLYSSTMLVNLLSAMLEGCLGNRTHRLP